MRPPIEIVAGRYRLLSLLGQGGMGSVWRGEHTSLHTPVAIKLLDPRIAEKEAIRGRFLREARSAASLRSKHVVHILDHGVEGDTPYIVMELLRGESLGGRLARPPRLGSREVARIFVQMGRAVARAHKAGVIHRDLKPDNVFLAESEDETPGRTGPGGRYTVKVVDFGIAKLTDDGALSDDVSTDTGAMIGTPHYMSPEQARSVKALDGRADLWSMAIIAFECMTGSRPFRADSLGDLIFRICAEPPPKPSSVAPVPDGFDAWFARATEKKPEDRFQDVSALVRGLEDVLTPGAHQFEPLSSLTPPSPDRAASMGEMDTTIAAETPGDVDSKPGADGPPNDEAPVPAQAGTKTEDPSTQSLAPTGSRPSRRLVVGAAVVACAAVAAGLALARSDGESMSPPVGHSSQSARAISSVAAVLPGPSVSASGPLPSASVASPATPHEIVLTVRTTPKDATLFRGSSPLGRGGEALHLPWTAEPFEITVRREGYATQKLTVNPAATVELTVVLAAGKSSKETPF